MIIETGKAYWVTMQRYNRNRNNPLMAGVAIRELRRLTGSPAVLKRINRFINNHASPPSGGPDGSGPRTA